MSSLAKRVEKEVKSNENMIKYELYGCLAGSCIITIGKLAGKSEKTIINEFKSLKDNKGFYNCKTIKEICEYLFDYFNVDEKYKDNIILIYDERNYYTPIVTLEVEGAIMPLDPENKIITGVFGNLGKDYIKYEYVFEEEEDVENNNI